jgi:hypothetical protein
LRGWASRTERPRQEKLRLQTRRQRRVVALTVASGLGDRPETTSSTPQIEKCRERVVRR